MVVVENTETVHNVIVCTLCSCYPWPVLGLPPSWYKDPPYRARMVREPRALLAEMPDLWDINIADYSLEMGVSRFVKEGALVPQGSKLPV